MVNEENINAFINYNYKPFNKIQCVKRLMLIWILSISMCFVGKHLIPWIVTCIFADLAISTFFIILIAKYSSSKSSRFLCDGTSYLYIAIILNLASYRFLTLQIQESWLLPLVLLSFLFACISIFVVVVYLNIKSNKYSAESSGKKIGSLSFLGGIFGILAARLFLQGESPEVAVMLVSFILLITSLVVGVGSLNLLKVIFMKKLKNT